MEVNLDWTEAAAVGHITVETDAGCLHGWVAERQVLARDFEERGFPRLASCIKRGGWPAAYINYLNVTKEDRGRGAGRTILEAALRRLSKAGIRYVFLHASGDPDWQQDLISFYEGSGFRMMEKCQESFFVTPMLMRADLHKSTSP